MQNLFQNPGFSMASLTAAINLLPNRYGRLEQLDIFPARPVRTRQIIVEEYAGRLNLLPTKPPGSPGTVGEHDARKLRSFAGRRCVQQGKILKHNSSSDGMGFYEHQRETIEQSSF